MLRHFSARLREARKLAKLTQEQLALDVGYADRRVIFAYERGTVSPTLKLTMKLAAHLGVKPAWLAGWCDEGGPDVAPSPRGTNSGGYVHPRTRKDMLSEGVSLGIPEVALKHYRLLKDGVKPTKQGFLDAEDLIRMVRAAKAAGQDPAALWASFLPSL